MKNFCFILFTITTFFSAVDLLAADFEVTPTVGYTFGGSFENSENGNTLDLAEGESYGVILGLRDKSNLKGAAFYEIFYNHQSTYLKGDEAIFSSNSHFNLDIDTLHFGGRYGSEGKMFNPYVAAGIGVTHFSPEHGESETKFSFSLGGGVNIPLTKHVGLRFEGRGVGTVFDAESSVFCINNHCLVQAEGDILWQFTGFTGVVFSF